MREEARNTPQLWVCHQRLLGFGKGERVALPLGAQAKRKSKDSAATALRILETGMAEMALETASEREAKKIIQSL